MATPLYPTAGLVDFVVSEAALFRSRDNVKVTQSGTALKSGTVLSKSATGTAAFAMDAGATGNPTSGTITLGAGAQSGTYTIEFTAATKFTVEDPKGSVVGTGTLGTAFSKGGLGFTLTAGATPAVAGDTAKVTVSATGSVYVAYTAGATASAILYTPLAAATGTTKAVAFTSDCEVSRAVLTGLDAAAETQLRDVGIKVRGTAGLPTVTTPAL